MRLSLYAAYLADTLCGIKILNSPIVCFLATLNSLNSTCAHNYPDTSFTTDYGYEDEMAPTLLTLPQEIRDIIYEFALTEKYGLIYQEDEHGVGRLCSGNLRRIVKACRFQEYGWESEDNNDGKRLRKLPVANQLQFTCRQLRQETKGVGLRLNRVVFLHRQHDVALSHCILFLRSLTAKQKESIKVTAMPHDVCWLGDISNVAELLVFCKDHPKSQVNVHFPSVPRDPYWYLQLAQVLHIFTGKQIPILASLPTEYQNRLLSHAYELFAVYIQDIYTDVPSNFRVFPSNETFEERILLMEVIIHEHTVLLSNDITTDNYIAWVKDWSENGM